MHKLLSSNYQSPSIKIVDLKIDPINPFNPISTKGEVEFVNLLLGMSYNMPKMLSSQYQSHSIKIENFKINPINLIDPISIKGRSEHFKTFTKNVL